MDVKSRNERKRAYDREYHRNRSKSSLDRKKKLQIINKEKKHDYIIEYLKSHPCVKCGESEVILLDFDHTYQDNKSKSISQMICINMSLSKIQEEIGKCQVLCVSCHRRKTAKQLGWYKYKKLNQIKDEG